LEPSEYTAQQRSARVSWLLACNVHLSTVQICKLTGLSPRGVRYLMDNISAAIPIIYLHGKWRRCPGAQPPAPRSP
jgi:hypothetical protein